VGISQTLNVDKHKIDGYEFGSVGGGVYRTHTGVMKIISVNQQQYNAENIRNTIRSGLY
jgi:hypothetical protein